VAIGCDDAEFAVFMNWVENKKHKKLQNVSIKIPFNICVLLFKNYIF
jgi:hypothetical protein